MIALSLNTASASANVPPVAAPVAQASAAPNVVAPARLKAAPAEAPLPLPDLAEAELKGVTKTSWSKRRFGLGWLQLGRAKRRLQTLETVSLGDKRFIALVRVDDRQFLIGGAPSSVGLLTELAHEESFHQVLNDATQGMRVSLDLAPSASGSSKLTTDNTILPGHGNDPFESPVDLLKLSPATHTKSAEGINEFFPSTTPVLFDEALTRAYSDIASIAATDAAAVLSPPPTPGKNDRSNNSVLPAMEASAPAVTLPAVNLELEPVLHAPVKEGAAVRLATAAPQISPTPNSTFQNWPAFVSNQPEKQKLATSVKSLPLQVAGFTWSWTGAAS